MGSLLLPENDYSTELIVKRSRFIGTAIPIVSRETAEERIAERKREYPDATHVVYAFVYGTEKSLQFGMSDDGEPKNTAGRPVLEVLRGSRITNCLITVVRYFGGTKLGTGGLVHAYSETAKRTIAGIKTGPYIERADIQFTCSYDLFPIIRQYVDANGFEVLNEVFETTVSMALAVPLNRMDEFDSFLQDVSRGSIQIG